MSSGAGRQPLSPPHRLRSRVSSPCGSGRNPLRPDTGAASRPAGQGNESSFAQSPSPLHTGRVGKKKKNERNRRWGAATAERSNRRLARGPPRLLHNDSREHKAAHPCLTGRDSNPTTTPQIRDSAGQLRQRSRLLPLGPH